MKILKNLKVMLIAAGIMASLSFANCYAMEKNENNKNITQEEKKPIICFTEEELEKLINKKEALENEEKKFKGKSTELNYEIKNLIYENSWLENKLSRIINEKEWYEHLYIEAQKEKIILENENIMLKSENTMLKKEREMYMKKYVKKDEKLEKYE